MNRHNSFPAMVGGGVSAIGSGLSRERFHYVLPPIPLPSATPFGSHLLDSPVEVWDAKHPLSLISRTHPYSSDAQASFCFETMKNIDSFFRENFRIYPVNNSTKLMRSDLRVTTLVNNACWSAGGEKVLFGILRDKGAQYLNLFEGDSDTIAHEFGHAVVHYASRFTYEGQSGALHESFADISAIMLKHYKKGHLADGPDTSWRIGENMFRQPYSSMCLRSMSHPGTAYQNHPWFGSDSQPMDMNTYQNLPITSFGDWGGVHVNNSIPSRAFYLAAIGIGGPSWETVGQIWYETLFASQSSDSFSTLASRTTKTAQLFGGDIVNKLGQAWQQVHVDLSGAFPFFPAHHDVEDTMKRHDALCLRLGMSPSEVSGYHSKYASPSYRPGLERLSKDSPAVVKAKIAALQKRVYTLPRHHKVKSDCDTSGVIAGVIIGSVALLIIGTLLKRYYGFCISSEI